MNEETPDSGIVTAVSGNQISVEVQRGGGCKSCAMRGMCLSQSTPAVFHLSSEIPLEVGDKVQLEFSPNGRVLASLLIFGLPVAFLFIGFIIASLWFTELISIILAFMAMALSFLLLRFCDRNLGSKISVEIARKL